MLLGIEIGGTKLQLGLGEADGKLAGLWRDRIDPGRGPAGIRQQIVEAMPELLYQATLPLNALAGVGVGFGGPVDDAGQVVIKSHQIDGWDNFPLANWIGNFLALPAFLANDSDAAGLAEAVCGAGKGLSPIYYMNIGSGIGGGFVLDGQVYRGTGRGARGNWPSAHRSVGRRRSGLPHVGRSGVRLGDRTPGQCGSPRSIAHRSGESYGSANRQIGTGRRSTGERDSGTGTGCVGGSAVPCGGGFLCPRRIVIGGGVAGLGEEILFAPLRERVKRRVFCTIRRLLRYSSSRFRRRGSGARSLDLGETTALEERAG